MNDNAGVVALLPRGTEPPLGVDAVLDATRLLLDLKAGGRPPPSETRRDTLLAIAAETLLAIDRLDQAAHSGASGNA